MNINKSFFQTVLNPFLAQPLTNRPKYPLLTENWALGTEKLN